MKKRLDIIIYEKALAKSRSAAQKMIALGDVTVNGIKAKKPSEIYDDETDSFSVSESSRVLKYVGRGGFKLETAIETFGIDLKGKICLDIGASSGGFTDCMLQNGAEKVYAVDVGTGQLDKTLKNDIRVVSLEQLDIRNAGKEHIPDEIKFIGIDVSFISLKLVLPEIKRFAAKDAECAALIKPQFEYGRKRNGKNGVIRDPKIHEMIVKDMCGFAASLGFKEIKTVRSKIDGGDGNAEFLMHFFI